MGDSEGPIDVSRWVVFYPIYINSKKTLAEGRRISTSAGVENPNVEEIHDCCNYLKLPCLVEPHKAYSRDFMQRGRVRVQLKHEDGTLVNPAISSRKALMLKVAELVPKHQGRAKKQQESASTSGATAGAGKSGKSGKKKK
ncbi:signal recognition particle subunit SRP19 [Marchantia polymorpha subsp. ruderalis]|uniref:Signal recognition particle 19 kDa protein n=2 Tax=Marchantia polymorpha TaxID=3197 RepID=A0A176VVA1_MARPO|nr:hypothetical protein AXG93_2601s1080 [Marchantia polymorpha subsp. ruderalis]PTQ49042.1 hypothetical protein MARPO_0004s0269 [Marchantia polymorpha]BBN05542.1 hypothetical protein Mp_3g14020 [Marchantia polymorpha subsp. ruderalis]|eukprot:PTQ49042.1 hypothetical protein MARPO_0004s0269 [Marchantia polymorpha]